MKTDQAGVTKTHSFRVAVLMGLAMLLAFGAAFAVLADTADAKKKKKKKRYRIVWVDQIVFASNRQTPTNPIPQGQTSPDLEIFSIKPDGTGLKQLTFNEVLDDGPVMSRNGAKIAYSSQDPLNNLDGDREIFVMNRDGSNKTNLTNNTSTPDLTPDFSPDGSTIAYTEGDFSAADIKLVKANNTESPQLFRSSPNWPEFRPVFSPDGQRIAYTSMDANAPNDFEILDLPVSNGNDIPRNLTNNTTEDYRPAYSPDGGKIYYDSAGSGPLNPDGDFDVMVMNSNGTGPANLTEVSLLDDLRPAVRLRSGTQIVFERLKQPATGGTSPKSTPRAKQGELWIMPATGIDALTTGRQLTDTEFAVINQSPDWGGYRIRVRR